MVVAVLQDGDGVVAPVDEQVDGLGAELGGVKAVEQQSGRPPRCVWPTFRVKIASRADSPRR